MAQANEMSEVGLPAMQVTWSGTVVPAAVSTEI